MSIHAPRPSRPCRYTVEQVLRGMQAFVTEWCGPDVVLDPDKSVNEYREAAAESHDCPLWFLEDLARYFELDWSYQRWIVWLKLRRPKGASKRERKTQWEQWKLVVAPTITVRSLANLIARRAVAPSFQPLNVFGRPCAPAGVFTGLTELPEVRGMRIGPSTELRILRRSGRIGRLCQRAQWITGTSLPPLSLAPPHRWPTMIGWAMIVSWIAAAIAFTSMINDANPRPELWLPWLIAFTCVSPVIAVVGAWIDGLRNPLPSEIRTFGDLSRLVAEQQFQSPNRT